MIRRTGPAWQPRGRGALLLLMLVGTLWCRPAWSVGTLTRAELERLLKVVDQHGTYVTLPQAVSSVLQLKPDQVTPDIKEVAFLDEDGTRHGFAPLKGGSGYFMFRSGTSPGQIVYAVDSDMRLVHAAQSLVKNGPLIALPDAEAQRSLDEEFLHWSKVLSPQGPVEALPFPFKAGKPPKTPNPEPQPFPFEQPAPSGAVPNKP